MVTNRRRFLGIAVAAVAVPPQLASAAPKRTLYLGTYGNGIGLARYDVASGRITSTGALEEVANPSFLIRSRSGRHLYAVNELADGGVTAIAVDRPGAAEGAQPGEHRWVRPVPSRARGPAPVECELQHR